jgi:hypothetical protein
MIDIEILKIMCDLEESVTSDNIQCAFNFNINGHPLDKNAFSDVADTAGDVKLMKYLHKNCPWDKITCENIAKSGYLECLKYVHEHMCPWDKITCAAAGFSGNVKCLEYAHTYDCPVNKELCLSVAKEPEIINYLQNL